MSGWSVLYQIVAKQRCPFCMFPLGRDRTGGHLVWCLYEHAAEVVFGPGAATAFPALRASIHLGLD